MDTYFSKDASNEIIEEFQPLVPYEFLKDGSFLSNDDISIDVSNRLVLSAFNSSGDVVSQACIALDRPVIFYPETIHNTFTVSNIDNASVPLWVTYDLGCYMALDAAGVQCAYIIPNRVVKKIQEIYKAVADSIDSISRTGFFSDIRLITDVNEIDQANKINSETSASIYFLDEPMQAHFETKYVHFLLDNAHEKTDKPEIEKDVYDAWKIRPVLGTQKKLTNDLQIAETKFKAAQLSYSLALTIQTQCPVFYSLHDIRNMINHPLVHKTTIDSIIRRISYMVNARKETALSAVKAKSWGNHKYIQVETLENLQTDTNVVLVTAPTGAGKTKHVITPFRNQAKNNDERFLTVAPLRTLIHELAHKLNTDHYEKIKTRAQAELSESMAVCLPSIMSLPLKPFIDRASYLAIDEISQNLRYTAVGKITVKGADHESVFMQLKELVRSSKKVVAADASIDEMTLSFFEDARPNERFTIVEQLPKNTGRECHVYQDMGDLIGAIDVELKSGGNVWIAVESADRAMALERFFTQKMTGDYSCMLICGENSDDELRKEFTGNIEEESRKYRIVIASPSISSGVSVEHQKPLINEDGQEVKDSNGKTIFTSNPHFTMIAGIASGHNIAPTDFMQMLARVRYIKDYHVCLMANNEKNNRISTESIITGQKKAAELEHKTIKENDFTEFRASVVVNNALYRADFASGFYWIMEYYKFNVVRHLDTTVFDFLKSGLKDTAKELKNERIISLMTAPPFKTQDEADALENKNNRTQLENIRIEAHKMRNILSLQIDDALTERDIDMAQNIKRLVRFCRFNGLVPKQDDSEKNIALRRFDHAQADCYKMLFDGIDLHCEEFTKDNAGPLIDMVINNRFLFVALGLVPKKYGAWVENKKTKELLPFKTPSYPVRELNSIIEMMGLRTRKREGTNNDYYQVTKESYENMCHYYKLKSKQLSDKDSQHTP